MATDLIELNPAARVPAIAGSGLSETDRTALGLAVAVLEDSTLVGRLSALAGRPLEILGRSLPAPAQEAVTRATEAALRAALRVALTTLGRTSSARFPRLDTALAATSGALGGALGLATLPLELPVSTVLMLRAIADIARQEGEDLSDPAVSLACLEVFAIGSRTEADDLSGGRYFAVRGVLARTVGQASKLALAGAAADTGAPALVRLVAQIASRFGIVVSQKVAAGAVPILGALGGGAVNAAFIEHFRTVARAHFTVRRLERTYGRGPVETAYQDLRAARAPGEPDPTGSGPPRGQPDRR